MKLGKCICALGNNHALEIIQFMIFFCFDKVNSETAELCLKRGTEVPVSMCR
jgi:hypothetical protein